MSDGRIVPIYNTRGDIICSTCKHHVVLFNPTHRFEPDTEEHMCLKNQHKEEHVHWDPIYGLQKGITIAGRILCKKKNWNGRCPDWEARLPNQDSATDGR